MSFSQQAQKDENTKQNTIVQKKENTPSSNEKNATVPTGKPVKMQNKLSGKYIGVLNNSRENGATIELSADNNKSFDVWIIQANSHNTKTDQHFYDLQNQHNQKYLSADKDKSTVNQWDSSIKDFRLWEIFSASNGYVKLKNKSTGKYLGIKGKEVGSKVVQLDENAKDEILWKPVE